MQQNWNVVLDIEHNSIYSRTKLCMMYVYLAISQYVKSKYSHISPQSYRLLKRLLLPDLDIYYIHLLISYY